MTTLCHPEPKAKDPVWRKTRHTAIDIAIPAGSFTAFRMTQGGHCCPERLKGAKDPGWRKIRHTAIDITLFCGILRFAQNSRMNSTTRLGIIS